MVILIDAGNTSIKLAPVINGAIGEITTCSLENLIAQLDRMSSMQDSIDGIGLCSVIHIHKDLLDRLEYIAPVFQVNYHNKLPFTNGYNGESLGNDRIALVAGSSEFESRNRLIIDIGTCITYDFITEHNHYLGGAISPGLELRYKSLHDYTAKLPLLGASKNHKLIGNDTHSSIHSGVINGTASEIDGYISQISQQYPDLITLITGGSSPVLTKQLKNRFFAPPNLVLQGIKILYEINQSN